MQPPGETIPFDPSGSGPFSGGGGAGGHNGGGGGGNGNGGGGGNNQPSSSATKDVPSSYTSPHLPTSHPPAYDDFDLAPLDVHKRRGLFGWHPRGICHRCCAGCSLFCTPRRKVAGLVLVASAVIGAAVAGSIFGAARSRSRSAGAGAAGETDEGADAEGGLPPWGTGLPPSTRMNVIHDAAEAAERFQTVRDRIVQADVVSNPQLLDPPVDSGSVAVVSTVPTPQHLAADWLATKDPAMLDVANDPNLLDRFAMAVLWFATYAPAHKADEVDPPPESDMEWANWDRHDNWMSRRGICAWRGVLCDGHTAPFESDGRVVNFTMPRNDIRGQIPLEFMKVHTDMVHLNLNENELSGSIPDMFRDWTRLEHLFLSHNYLEGTFPDSLVGEGKADVLRSINLGKNFLEGPLPPNIGDLHSLRRLSVFENSFSGTIPASIDGLSQLVNLFLDSNSFTGTIPPGLYKLPELTDLRLRDNEFEGTISESVGDMTKLTVLYLDSNALSGPLPYRLDDVPNLKELHLYDNRLTGTLPPEWNELHSLNSLFLDGNRFTGPIPHEWGAYMRELTHLFLFDNDLTGYLPPDLNRMEKLVELRVNGNRLKGSIPSGMGSLTELRAVMMENNRLEGRMPEELGQLGKLEEFKVHLNDLTGTVPPSICALFDTGSLYTFSSDCRGDDPEVVCECCTHCFESKAVPPPPNHWSRDGEVDRVPTPGEESGSGREGE